MRKLIMAVAVLGMSATMNFAKAQCVNEYGNKEPFAVEFSRLSSYLGLAPYQMEEVLNINDYFVQEQRKSLSKDLKRQNERLQKAVYGNLKLMKEALTADQYRKYVILLNVTNNNNRLTGTVTFTDIYLAENK
ncbi:MULTISPECIES: hypothetical protein [Parabacteroides]|uniref:hypothetical protein n=1 Tax=Parabacteroides TaxID=375288 RepID=UPI000EF72B84|nr:MULTISPECIES: hypothetical protein [Parabacteroides]RKU62588.1 hypothetical protein DWX33_02430 [Parabacteroides sp. AF19-14]RLT69491.1 hypothetical protein D7V92_10970 [Parabacteroides sp. CH2-D42-20]